MRDEIECFRDAMRAVGLSSPDAIEPGKLIRFPGIRKRQSNKAGWCLMFEDGLGGCFGDWSSGINETWQATRRKPCTRAERRGFMRQVEEARKRADSARRALQAEAAGRAAAIWLKAPPAPANHPYLTGKRIHPHGARLWRGALTLPVVDFSGSIASLQFITANGRKKLLSCGRKRGCFIPVAGDGAHPVRIIICEGWATGCTLAEDEPLALVLAAIDAGNLESVALNARTRWPEAELIIAGDDDRLTVGNPGATKSRIAALASGALLALPPWPTNAPHDLTDFNDLAVWMAGGGA